MPRGIGTSTGVKLTVHRGVGERREVLDDLGGVPVDAADAVRRGVAHHLAAEQVRLGRLARPRWCPRRRPRRRRASTRPAATAGASARRRRPSGSSRERRPGGRRAARRAGPAARAGRRARCRRARRRRTAAHCAGVAQPEVGPAVDHERVVGRGSAASGAGLAVRQRQEDHVVAGQGRGRGLGEHPVGERRQVRLERAEASRPRCDPAVSAPISTSGMRQQQTQQLAAGVPAGTGDRDPDRAHVHDHTYACMFTAHTGRIRRLRTGCACRPVSLGSLHEPTRPPDVPPAHPRRVAAVPRRARRLRPGGGRAVVPRLARRRPALAPRRGAALVDLDGRRTGPRAPTTTPSPSGPATTPGCWRSSTSSTPPWSTPWRRPSRPTRPGPGTPSTRTSRSSSAARPTRR